MNRRSTALGAAISLLVIVGLLAVVWLVTHPRATAPATPVHPTSSHAASRSPAGHTAGSASGHQGTDPATGLAWIAAADLPKEGRDTLALIDKGGPFPYPDHDGVVFTNAEGHLPRHPNGYYHEYTVPTPGSRDRGTRRIVAGGPGEFFYTDDHYDTFSRIRR